jgi:hypothetical protein
LDPNNFDQVRKLRIFVGATVVLVAVAAISFPFLLHSAFDRRLNSVLDRHRRGEIAHLSLAITSVDNPAWVLQKLWTAMNDPRRPATDRDMIGSFFTSLAVQQDTLSGNFHIPENEWQSIYDHFLAAQITNAKDERERLSAMIAMRQRSTDFARDFCTRENLPQLDELLEDELLEGAKGGKGKRGQGVVNGVNSAHFL